MKKLICAFCLLASISLAAVASGQEKAAKKSKTVPYQKVNNQAFQAGEVLKFKLAYGFINAGVAEISVKKSSKQIQGRELLHVVGTGRSISAFDWFFEVRDRYETYLDKEGIFPWLFVRRINEGGYKSEQDYYFYQNIGKVKDEDDIEYDVPHGVQDMLSAFYYARTIDFSNAKKGDVFTFQSFVDEEVYPAKIKYAGTKTVRVEKGKFDCMVFHPVVQEGRIFKDDDDLTVYITNDENKIPVLAKAKILVGSIRMELTDYEGLKNPVAKK